MGTTRALFPPMSGVVRVKLPRIILWPVFFLPHEPLDADVRERGSIYLT